MYLVHRMLPLPDDFAALVGAMLRRFFVQNGRTAPADAVVAEFAGSLHRVVSERGLPPPLPPGEIGRPGGMDDEECARLVARLASTDSDPLLLDAARQLVKACFHPEFAHCRNSYREVGKDGSCRRQELRRVRGRISGTHCIDCPHWTALQPDEHVELLRREWMADRTELEQQRAVFLPEDFRAFRRWRHAAARQPRTG